jgi:hypothetical protein
MKAIMIKTRENPPFSCRYAVLISAICGMNFCSSVLHIKKPWAAIACAMAAQRILKLCEELDGILAAM